MYKNILNSSRDDQIDYIMGVAWGGGGGGKGGGAGPGSRGEGAVSLAQT
jgi:hypothetical protein